MLGTHPLVQQVNERLKDPTRITTMIELQSRVPNLAPLPPRQLPPPATLKVLHAAEQALGFRLPGLLSELYLNVANGGFGPGNGIVGLPGSYLERDDIAIHDGQGLDLVDLYYGFRGHSAGVPSLDHDFEREAIFTMDPEGWWYDKLLVICNHGCWQLSCIDCSKGPAPVLTYIGYNMEFRLMYPTFEDWVEAWLDGKSVY